jgi:hypothetical protein
MLQQQKASSVAIKISQHILVLWVLAILEIKFFAVLTTNSFAFFVYSQLLQIL